MKITTKNITYPLTYKGEYEDRVDIKLVKKNSELMKFAINYRAKILGKWRRVWRVDNAHGYIHKQELWRTKKPIPLKNFESWNMKDVFDYFFKDLEENCERYVRYYEEKLER